MISQKNITRFLLIVDILLLVCLSLNILLYPPSSGYELSPYSSAKSIFFLISSIYVLSLVGVIISKKVQQKFFVFFLLTSCLYIISTPLWKKYFFFSRADGLRHIGHVIDILTTGKIPSTNYYPAIHIIIIGISYLADISFLIITGRINLLFFAIYVLSIYTLTKNIFTKLTTRRYIILSILLIPSIFLAPLSPAPHTFALNLFPLLLYLYLLHFKIQQPKTTFLLSLVSVFLPILHPLFSLFWTYFLGLMLFLDILTNCNKRNALYLTEIVILSVVSFISWFSRTVLWKRRIMMVLRWFVTPENYVSISEVSKISHFSFWKLTTFIFKWFGGYITMGVVVLLALFELISKRQYIQKTRQHKLLIFIFVASTIWTILLTFVLPTGSDIFRGIRYSVFSLELMFGYALYKNIVMKNYKRWLWVSLLIFISTLHIFNTLPSPFIEAPNGQFTIMEFTGTKWLLQNKDTDNPILGISPTTISAASNSILGVSDEAPRNQYVGDHFKNIFIHNLNSYYIWLSYADVVKYLKLWNETERFTPSDFREVRVYQKINQIYYNRGLWVYVYWGDTK